MNKMYFFVGLFSTMGISNSLMNWIHWHEFLITNLVSLIGGVLASVVVAWVQRREGKEAKGELK